MDMNRRGFLKGGLAALGFLALNGLPVFAAPQGWKPSKKPNLVFGVLSDTHLMVNRYNGKTLYPTMSLDYIRNAFKFFKAKNIDAFVHLGDASHRGDIREWEFHKAWNCISAWARRRKSWPTGRTFGRLCLMRPTDW